MEFEMDELGVKVFFKGQYTQFKLFIKWFDQQLVKN